MGFFPRAHFLLVVLVKCRVGIVDVFRVQHLSHFLDGTSKALEVNNLPLAQESNNIRHIRVIFCQAGEYYRRSHGLFVRPPYPPSDHRWGHPYADGCRRPRKAGSRCGINTSGVIHKVSRKRGIVLDLIVGQVTGQLVDDGGNHLKVPKFIQSRKLYVEGQSPPGPSGAMGYTLKCTSSVIGSGLPQRRLPAFLFLVYTMRSMHCFRRMFFFRMETDGSCNASNASWKVCFSVRSRSAPAGYSLP